MGGGFDSLGSFLGLVLLVLSLDSLELSNVLVEVLVLLKSDEKLGLLLLTVLLSLHSDGLSLDLLEDSVVVSAERYTIKMSQIGSM